MATKKVQKASQKKAAKKQPEKKPVEADEKRKSRMDVFIKLVLDGKARTRAEYAEAIQKELPQFTTEKLLGFVHHLVRFASGIGALKKDGDGKYSLSK